MICILLVYICVWLYIFLIKEKLGKYKGLPFSFQLWLNSNHYQNNMPLFLSIWLASIKILIVREDAGQ